MARGRAIRFAMVNGEYGSCPCGGLYEARFVTVNMTVEGAPVTIDDVPQGACPSCGSRVYKLPVLARIEATMKHAVPARAGLDAT